MVTGTWNLTSLRKSVIFEAWVRNIARRLAERDLARRANSRTQVHITDEFPNRMSTPKVGFFLFLGAKLMTQLRMNRSIQVEGVFGVLKEDYGFRRFLTRGKKNMETQFFLLAFALNIEKLCNRTKKGRIGLDLFQLNVS